MGSEAQRLQLQASIRALFQAVPRGRVEVWNKRPSAQSRGEQGPRLDKQRMDASLTSGVGCRRRLPAHQSMPLAFGLAPLVGIRNACQKTLIC